ncbi:hypothetical protein AVEN_8541-1 [Araneus ventricosus]|uniref:Uncharacterized protein n=1 Tax=Araneus ventricosus TaxID=182803 RepID=A0A4Y2FK32_ARAVE|nr:hypothetical protein AVEN_8541-1 [Araneus ventricosus]
MNIALVLSDYSYIDFSLDFPLRCVFNPLTHNPAVTDHATSILVGRISAGYCSESGEKAVGLVVTKGTLRGEIRDERPSIHIFHHPVVRRKVEMGWTNLFHLSISKRTSVYTCTQILRTLRGHRIKSLKRNKG